MEPERRLSPHIALLEARLFKGDGRLHSMEAQTHGSSRVGVLVSGMSRLDQLYATHSRSAVRLAYLLTGDIHCAEDIVQDAFVKLAGRFRHLADVANFEHYLNRIVLNLSRDHFRRLRVQRRYLAREEAEAKTSSTEPISLEDQTVLMQALRKLSSRQRAAVVLRYYRDLSEQQIADTLDCSVGAVKSLLLRGKEKLRDSIEGIEQ